LLLLWESYEAAASGNLPCLLGDVKMTYGWSIRDTQFLIDNHDALSICEIAERLGKRPDAVREKIIRLRKRGVPLPLYNPAKRNEPLDDNGHLWPP